MILKSLDLGRYRGFDALEIKFHDRLNVIAGVNGIGKSSILEALTVLLARALPQFTPASSIKRNFATSDIKDDTDSLIAIARMEIEGRTWGITIIETRDEVNQIAALRKQLAQLPPMLSLDTNQDKAKRRENERQIRQRIADLESTSFGELSLISSTDKEQLNTRMALRERKVQPIAVYFPSMRQIPPRFLKTGPSPSKARLDVMAAYRDALQERAVNLKDFAEWYSAKTALASEFAGKHSRTLEALQEAVTSFLEDFSDLRLESEPTVQLVVNKRGLRYELNQLSDGERGLLALIFDLTRRLSLANPDLENPARDGVAIVLIDEIELHLHPSWQRFVLRRLQKTFQNCQFIVTTHSPQIIGQVKPESLIVLTRELETSRIVVKQAGQSFAMSSNWVLEEIMGTPARDYETELKIQSIFEHVDKEELEAARSEAKALEDAVGLFPELQGIKSLLDRLEMLAGDA
jgi:predicted ATP-binding protein involved in virulence